MCSGHYILPGGCGQLYGTNPECRDGKTSAVPLQYGGHQQGRSGFSLNCSALCRQTSDASTQTVKSQAVPLADSTLSFWSMKCRVLPLKRKNVPKMHQLQTQLFSAAPTVCEKQKVIQFIEHFVPDTYRIKGFCLF